MTPKYRFSEFSDVTETYLTPTDVKQYVFCPRVTYFTRLMRLRPIMDSQQEAGKKSHEKLITLEDRRKTILKANLPFFDSLKRFDVYLRCDRMGVRGRLDMVLETTEGELIPVEFKSTASNRGNPHLDHKYQLVMLALLVESCEGTIVRRGILYYMQDDSILLLPITQGLKKRTQTYLKRIRRMLRGGTVPEPRRACVHARVGCGFADQCRDL